MNWKEAGILREAGRKAGVKTDRMGLPPWPGVSESCNSPCFVVFWLNGRDFEFEDAGEAKEWLLCFMRLAE